MKRVLAAIALTLPLFAVGPGAQPAGAVPSDFCTDGLPTNEQSVLLFDNFGLYLAAVVWPTTTQPLVGLCHRLPTGQGGAIVVDVIDLSTVSPTNVTADVDGRLTCHADPSPNPLLCSVFLGGVELQIGVPALTSTGSGICVIGGACTPTRVEVTGPGSSLTVYLPVTGTPLSVPIIVTPLCVVDFTGAPC